MQNSGTAGELSMMPAVNDVIDELHRSLGLAASDFFCECGHSDCTERIPLTRTEYARLRKDDQPVLVARHADRGPGGAFRHKPRVPTRASHRRSHEHGGWAEHPRQPAHSDGSRST